MPKQHAEGDKLEPGQDWVVRPEVRVTAGEEQQQVKRAVPLAPRGRAGDEQFGAHSQDDRQYEQDRRL